MNQTLPFIYFERLMRTRPNARAELKGSDQYPSISGTVRFYETPYGSLVVTEVLGLPNTQNACASPVFGFHIHEGGVCTGDRNDPFADALTHYDPVGCPHPYHAGDLPPLFSANGRAFSACLTDRFSVNEIIGKTVILHAFPDDFTTQPSGNSRTKIACGVISGSNRRRR